MDIFSPNIVEELLNSYVIACGDSIKNLTKASSKEVRINEIERALGRAGNDKHRLQFFGYMFTGKLFYDELDDWHQSIWNIVLENGAARTSYIDRKLGGIGCEVERVASGVVK